MRHTPDLTITRIGIPEDKFETIFEHFSRLSPSYQGATLRPTASAREADRSTIRENAVANWLWIFLPSPIMSLPRANSFINH